MTGLEKILNSIDDEATLLAEKTITEAKLQAEEILAQAKLTAQKEVQTIAKAAELEVELIEKRAQSQIELQSRELLLKAKCEMITRTISKAKDVLKALPDKDYFEVMERLFEKHMQPKKGELIFSETDRKRLPSEFKANITKLAKSIGGEVEVSEQIRNLDGGFVLSYGNIEENCSFEALFVGKYELLRDKVNEILFS